MNKIEPPVASADVKLMSQLLAGTRVMSENPGEVNITNVEPGNIFKIMTFVEKYLPSVSFTRNCRFPEIDLKIKVNDLDAEPKLKNLFPIFSLNR